MSLCVCGGGRGWGGRGVAGERERVEGVGE